MIGGIIVGLMFGLIVIYFLGMTKYIEKLEGRLKTVEMVLIATDGNLKPEPKSKKLGDDTKKAGRRSN